MHLNKWGSRLALALVFVGALACRTADVFIAQATVTPTRTPRPTFTPLPPPTNTAAPLPTVPPTLPPTVAVVVPKTPTRAPTARPPTARPPTQPPVALPPAQPQPTAVPVSTFEFHVNPPSCVHAGNAYIKGIVYNDKNDPSNRYVGALVALGDSSGASIWVGPIKSDDFGEYTFTLNSNGAAPGNYWVWLVDPTQKRKSDIGGPITMNNLPDTDPKSCWAGNVDFWK